MPSQTNIPVIFLAFANDRGDEKRYLSQLPQEQRRILDALEQADSQGACELKDISNATIEQIFDVFQKPRYRNRIAIFHFGGHADSYKLLLETADGQAKIAHAEGLAGFLGQQDGLQLVFLNGCSTRPQVERLLEAGVTNVIATSKAIDDQVATDFASRFYQGLAGGVSIGKAFSQAEGAVLTACGDNTRALYWSDSEITQDPGLPWKLYPEDKPEASAWDLAKAAGDPLFGLPPLPRLDLPKTPFIGLEHFTRRHAMVFFGRGRDIRELYDGVTAADGDPIILLYGQSGVGKSSLLDAGLLPRLEADCIVRYRPRNKDLGLLGTLRRMLDGDQSDETVDRLWHTLEETVPRKQPVVVILDQVEEIFAQHDRPVEQELQDFFQALHDLFGDAARRPRGRLILGFRKEWLAEIEKQCDQNQLSYRSVFLTPMDRKDIVEAVEGPQRAARLRSKYHLAVENGLGVAIAERLTSDPDSPIAPTLQILLTRLWEEATSKSKSQPCFDLDLFKKVARKGTALTKFLDRQFETLESLNKPPVESGLILDLLAYHVTPEGTAAECAKDKLYEQYSHQTDSLPSIIDSCKDLYLLTGPLSEEEEKKDDTRLAHDTLAPLLKHRFDTSDKPGQRARRILESRAIDWRRNKKGIPLDNLNL